MPRKSKAASTTQPSLLESAIAPSTRETADTVDRPFAAKGLFVGTSAFTAAGWPGAFYPPDMNPRDYLTFYSTQFNTVEVDSTFYRCPPASTVTRWYAVTPPGFVFSLKVPQTITHEKCLDNCDRELDEFLSRAALLREKLGVLLLQFPYFNRQAFKAPAEFFTRLRAFLEKTSRPGQRWAVEIRNKSWLTAEFAALLREHHVSLALQDQLWMPLPAAMHFDYFTAPFTYIRLLGDRQGIEKRTKVWDQVIVDRSQELRSWVDICQRAVHRGVVVFIYVNNHYAGFAPGTIAQFIKLWKEATDRVGLESR